VSRGIVQGLVVTGTSRAHRVVDQILLLIQDQSKTSGNSDHQQNVFPGIGGGAESPSRAVVDSTVGHGGKLQLLLLLPSLDRETSIHTLRGSTTLAAHSVSFAAPAGFAMLAALRDNMGCRTAMSTRQAEQRSVPSSLRLSFMTKQQASPNAT